MSEMSEEPKRLRRLFIALWPADELRHDIELETRHAVQHSGGRVIPACNFHITLAFLGSVPEARVADARECVAMTNVKSCELVLGAMSWWQKQGLLCLEPTAGADALVELVGRLQTVLCANGFSIDDRLFRPHVTLAREVRREHAFKPIRQLRWQVHRIELVESQTLPAGSVYTILPT